MDRPERDDRDDRNRDLFSFSDPDPGYSDAETVVADDEDAAKKPRNVRLRRISVEEPLSVAAAEFTPWSAVSRRSPDIFDTEKLSQHPRLSIATNAIPEEEEDVTSFEEVLVPIRHFCKFAPNGLLVGLSLDPLAFTEKDSEADGVVGRSRQRAHTNSPVEEFEGRFSAGATAAPRQDRLAEDVRDRRNGSSQAFGLGGMLSDARQFSNGVGRGQQLNRRESKISLVKPIGHVSGNISAAAARDTFDSGFSHRIGRGHSAHHLGGLSGQLPTVDDGVNTRSSPQNRCASGYSPVEPTGRFSDNISTANDTFDSGFRYPIGPGHSGHHLGGLSDQRPTVDDGVNSTSFPQNRGATGYSPVEPTGRFSGNTFDSGFSHRVSTTHSSHHFGGSSGQSSTVADGLNTRSPPQNRGALGYSPVELTGPMFKVESAYKDAPTGLNHFSQPFSPRYSNDTTRPGNGSYGSQQNRRLSNGSPMEDSEGSGAFQAKAGSTFAQSVRRISAGEGTTSLPSSGGSIFADAHPLDEPSSYDRGFGGTVGQHLRDVASGGNDNGRHIGSMPRIGPPNRSSVEHSGRISVDRSANRRTFSDQDANGGVTSFSHPFDLGNFNGGTTGPGFGVQQNRRQPSNYGMFEPARRASASESSTRYPSSGESLFADAHPLDEPSSYDFGFGGTNGRPDTASHGNSNGVSARATPQKPAVQASLFMVSSPVEFIGHSYYIDGNRRIHPIPPLDGSGASNRSSVQVGGRFAAGDGGGVASGDAAGARNGDRDYSSIYTFYSETDDPSSALDFKETANRDPPRRQGRHP